jgi:hypothetical protein
MMKMISHEMMDENEALQLICNALEEMRHSRQRVAGIKRLRAQFRILEKTAFKRGRKLLPSVKPLN